MKLDGVKLLASLPPAISAREIEADWRDAARRIARVAPKILVLDDDPTGTQTVANVPVWTRWDENSLVAALEEGARVVFVLTNSRALSAAQSRDLHTELSRNLRGALAQTGAPLPLVISRGDSTLRGHYPLETRVINEELFGNSLDGEILIPFFAAGGRVTMGDIHWVREGETLVPAGQTEFARDPDFGYASSDLRAWIEEKSGGATKARDVTSIGVEALRARDVDGIAAQLFQVKDFGKVIVNAVVESDLQVFAVALARALEAGQRFLFRSAASWVPILAGFPPAPLWAPDEKAEGGAGLIVVGSFVEKTTRQLRVLQAGAPELAMVELDVTRVQDDALRAAEIARAQDAIVESWRHNRAVCLFSSRLYQSQTPNASARVAAAQVEIVSGALRNAARPPAWIIAKGGITSSEIATRALGAVRAQVLGPIAPGVPVWKVQSEVWRGGTYVVFPGNVGGEDALLEVYRTLEN